MRHFVLTRSAYGPAWTLEANRRRLEMTRAVTARLMAAQTNRDWTWIVLLDEHDPLYDERAAVFTAAAPRFVALPWIAPRAPKAAPWGRDTANPRTVQLIAASAYRAPWREAMGVGSTVKVLMTRLDDDDGLAPDAIARYQSAAGRLTKRAVLMLPSGIRVWRGHYSDVRHARNAMHTLVTPPGDNLSVYDYCHATAQKVAPILEIDQAWGWIWVRHQDTISGWKRAADPITRVVRSAFPVDWAALGAMR